MTFVPFVEPESDAHDGAEEGQAAEGPWADYLAAAQRLDAVRRAASSAAGEQAATVQAAQQELASVRARLAPQRARLVQDLGVPEADAAAAARPSGRWPRRPSPAAPRRSWPRCGRPGARPTPPTPPCSVPGPAAPWRPWARNLLVYGPFAAAVLIVQIVLYLVAPSGSLPTYALLCGLSMPVLAFGLGWLTIGFVYGGGRRRWTGRRSSARSPA